MEPPVLAAVISSCTALGIAVVGVIATGLAQTRATKQAHQNALDLFDRQSRERVSLAHLDQKRTLYAELPRVVDDLADATEHERIAFVAWRDASQPDFTGEPAMEAARVWREAVADGESARLHWAQAYESLMLVAPSEVVTAVEDWVNAVETQARALDSANRDRTLLVERATAAKKRARALMRVDLGVQTEAPTEPAVPHFPPPSPQV